MQYFFTADQHYGHAKLIQHLALPFSSIQEKDEFQIDNHNSVVSPADIVVHAGDFTLIKNRSRVYREYVNRLNGKHIFLEGSHDYWLKGEKGIKNIWGKEFTDRIYIVVCHYAMRVWHRSHWNSWQLYGHAHGHLPPVGKQHDVGVDNNNYYPVSFDEIAEIMQHREDNPNKLEKESR